MGSGEDEFDVVGYENLGCEVVGLDGEGERGERGRINVRRYD